MSDIFGGLDLSVYPLIALPIFIGVFLIIVIRALRAPRSEMRYDAMLPLNDDPRKANAYPNDNANGKEPVHG